MRSFILSSLACLVIIGFAFLGYGSYNNGCSLGYEYGTIQAEAEFDRGYSLGYEYGTIQAEAEFDRGYSLGYEYGTTQDEAEYNEGYNHGYEVAYQETAVLSEGKGSGNQTITLKNPTFEEARDFILRDSTSRNQFVLNQYECRHFTTDVKNNAEAEGLRSAFVLLCYDRGQHAVIAFDTTDQGLVYIEPQTNARIYPEVGGTYQGREIKEILIAW